MVSQQLIAWQKRNEMRNISLVFSLIVFYLKLLDPLGVTQK